MTISQREEEANEVSSNNQDAESKTRSDDEKTSGDDNLGEWLSLSLSRNEAFTTGDGDPQSNQLNAHKRERGAAKRYQSHRMMMATMGFPLNSLTIRSLGAQPHSLAHKPGREGTEVAARFNDPNTGFRMAWTPFVMEEAMDSIWPGSFHVDKLPSQASDQHKLDLNLSL
ncbi:hypothetical protein CK203_078886 [Vitis vinifera]|uniref:Uncharacterized protein n=1 Tax=Vitis vinifera TaxID=29760 RepID=A0A438FC07_VITVI|nr:hypothetical protein CK203_078886 [Vitis vinifera]